MDPHPAAAPAPAGWYPDPSGRRDVLRFYDGTQWTERTGPAHAGVAPPGGFGGDPADPVHWLLPTGRTWQAIASGYAGLVSLAVWPLGPVAVALGTWALRRSGASGRHGRVRAVFGMVSGGAASAALVWVLVAAAA